MYNKYFGIDTKTPEFIPQANVKHINNAIVKDKGRWHTTETTPGIDTFDIPVLRRMADENMDSLEQLAFVLKKLCNAAWGEGWGEFSPDLKKVNNNMAFCVIWNNPIFKCCNDTNIFQSTKYSSYIVMDSLFFYEFIHIISNIKLEKPIQM